MKKLFLAILALIFLSTNALAWWTGDGKITRIESRPDGDIQVVVTVGTNNYWKMLNAANKKELLTIALTASASGSTVDAYITGGIVDRLVIK